LDRIAEGGVVLVLVGTRKRMMKSSHNIDLHKERASNWLIERGRDQFTRLDEVPGSFWRPSTRYSGVDEDETFAIDINEGSQFDLMNG
jgi:hypothetical protein